MKKMGFVLSRARLALAPVLLGSCASLALASTPPSGYTIEDLGVLGNGDYGTRASAINAAGDVVGFSGGAPCTLNGFVWNGAIQHIPDGTACSTASAINVAGQIAGSLDHSYGGGCYHAFRLTGSTMEDLAGLNSDLDCSDGYDINAAGRVVGRAYNVTNLDTYHPVLWDVNNGIVDLGSLDPNRSRGFALGINASGQVVGTSATRFTPPNVYWDPGHAFLWDGGTMHDLNDSSFNIPPGWELKKASDINDAGQIVGYGTHGGLIRAFRYSLAGFTMKDLGTFPGGGISHALGLNRFGDVVGAAYLDATGAGNYRAFVYTEPGGMRNLNDLISPSAGWRLREATAINDHGQIAGWGERNGQVRAFRLTPKPTIVVDGTSYQGPARIITVLGVRGSYFTPAGSVRILVNTGKKGTRIANANGDFSFATTAVSCDEDLEVQAEDMVSGALSDPATLHIDCP